MWYAIEYRIAMGGNTASRCERLTPAQRYLAGRSNGTSRTRESGVSDTRYALRVQHGTTRLAAPWTATAITDAGCAPTTYLL